MKVSILSVGPIGTNCYLLYGEDGDCAVIDPGAGPEKIAARMRELSLTPRMILLTHGHYDHIGGIPGLKALYPSLPVYVHEKDKEMMEDPEKNFSTAFDPAGFTVTPDGCALRLRWRTPDEDDLLERLPLENLPFTAPDGTATPLDAMVGDRRAVLFILDANGSEPSIHVLDELREFLTEHADTEVEPILALSPAQTPASDPIMRMMDRLPRPFELWRCDEATASRLARITFVDPDKMPLIIAVHPAADGGPTTGVYACSGYNVGSVALAMRLNRLTGSRS